MGWGDLWSDPYPLGAILFMMTLDIKLYATVGWYLEQVGVCSVQDPQLCVNVHACKLALWHDVPYA